MRRALPFLFLLPLLLEATATAAQERGIIHVRIETELGMITAAIDSVHAPITAANFLRYVDAGSYRDARFHRTVRADNQPNDSIRIAVAQAGLYRQRDPAPVRFPPIPLERTSVTGLRHVDGCLSMARNGPDTARSDFSICIGDQPDLDFAGRRNPDGQGFAVFGRVIDGMDVARRINQQPANGQTLAPPVRILNISRL